MKERVITAIILASIVLVCLFATSSPIPMIVLLVTAVTVGAAEWLKLMPVVRQPAIFVLSIPFVAACLYLAPRYLLMPRIGTLQTPVLWLAVWLVATVFWLFALRWVMQFPRQVRWYGKRLYAAGILLLVSTALAVLAIWRVSPWWMVYVIGLVSGADVGAYLVGRKLGKTKLAPHVSPAKSIEGFFGGFTLTSCITLAVALLQLHLTGSRLLLFVGLSLITVLSSVLGDLFESMLKRQSNIKDSGNILPGHGGVLDRLDSLLAAASVFALGFFALGGF